jgi:hypothetical protein
LRVINLDSLIAVKRAVGREKDLYVARELDVIRSLAARRKPEDTAGPD